MIKSIKKFIVNFTVSNKETIKKIPILGNVARRIYQKMITSGLDYSFMGSKHILSMEGDKALVKTIWGDKIWVNTKDVSIAPSLLLNGCWEMQVTKVIMGLIKEGMNVLEIGANIGYFSLLFASRIGERGKLYAFEANPDVFETLKLNMDVNGYNDKVKLVNTAVMDKPGKIYFNVLKRYHGAGSIHSFSEDFLEKIGDEVNIIEVGATSINDYFKDNKIRIDVIKIDAEGSEPYIFDGMKQIIFENADIAIICEFSPALISGARDPRKFLEEIKDYGFVIKVIDNASHLIDLSIEELLKAEHCELFLKR